MRDRYLFKPAVPLHERPEMSRDCATLKEAIGEDPFEWRPEQAMPWTYEFVDGVMVVYDGPDKVRGWLLIAACGSVYDGLGKVRATGSKR